MLGNASLMRLELPAHSPHLASISDIEAAARRAADLCRQMLAYSGRGRFIIERVDVNTLIEDMARLLELSISKQAVLRYHLTAAPLYVEADVTQLRQIIMNLVINASEAVGARSGVIALATGVARLDAEYLRTLQSFEDLPPGDYVTIEVSDDGSGMDGDTLRRIFEPFFTTKFTGRGLGLAAVQGIVRGHKGGLKVYSEVGKGTTFRLLLPASERSEAVVPRVESTPAPGPISRGTVLVVDDEETVRSVAARLLERMGLEVVLAGDGREGVDKFRADPARYALVLLDLTMPHLDGEETFRQLRHIRPGIRVILSSGFNHQEVLTRFAGKGLAGFVQKPFEARTLMNEVSRVIADS
jgi:CheY-like chemotaxis protein